MKRLAMIGAMSALALLAACGDTSDESGPTVVETEEANGIADPGIDNAALGNTAIAVPVVKVSGDGLLLAMAGGRTREVPFATGREASIEAITSALGAPTGQGSNPECGAGPLDNVDFAGGLTMLFQDGRFVGWSLDGRQKPAFTTASGIGIGSTIAQLRASGDVSVQETSLGTEFQAGGMAGTATANRPDAKITEFWGGMSCIFR